MVRRNVGGDTKGDKFDIDSVSERTFTSPMGFDGAGPERSTDPTWRGVITAAIVIFVVVVLIFFVYSQVVSDVRAS